MTIDTVAFLAFSSRLAYRTMVQASLDPHTWIMTSVRKNTTAILLGGLLGLCMTVQEILVRLVAGQ